MHRNFETISKTISLTMIFWLGGSLFPGVTLAQGIVPHRPSIPFDLQAFEVVLASCEGSGRGSLILRAMSAKLLRRTTEVNARTDLEMEVDTEGFDATIEIMAEGESQVRLNTTGKPQQILPNKQPFSDALTAHPSGEDFMDVFSIDRRVKLRDIADYLEGLAAGPVVVSVSVAHQLNLSAKVTCPDDTFETAQLGTLRWTRNYAVVGDWNPTTGNLDSVQLVLDPNRPELADATLEPVPED
jgi:hypothetical protein